MLLSAHDYKQVLGLIDFVYSVPDRTKLFKATCEQLHKIVPISSVAFIPVNRRTEAFQVSGGSVFNTEITPTYLFVAYYAPFQPYIAQKANHNIRHLTKAVRRMDVASTSQLQDTAVACDLQPLTDIFYELDLWLAAQCDLVGAMGFLRQRPARDFSEREQQIVALLVPHLARSMHLIELRQDGPARDTGVIVIGTDGRPQYMNEEAIRVLKGGSVGIVRERGINSPPTFFWTATGVYRVITHHQAGGEQKDKPIVLAPLYPEQLLRCRLGEFGLSLRQQEVAMWVSRGLSNREIAEKLFICEQTVKDHLHDIFERMHVRRRSQLTAKLLMPAVDDRIPPPPPA